MALTNIKVEQQESIWIISINRPDNENRLSIPLMIELCSALNDADSNEHCRVIILTGTGEYFCNGGALGDFRQQSAIEIRRFGDAFINLHMAIVKLSKPVIAAVQGSAHGGGLNLVEACDVAVAADEAEFSVPELRFGIAPMMALTGLVRVLGRKNVMKMAYFAESISAQQAEERGFVTYTCPCREVMSKAFEIANKLAIKNPVALAACKRLYYETDALSYQRQLESGLNMLVSLLKSKDAAEAISAREEDRLPVWSGM